MTFLPCRLSWMELQEQSQRFTTSSKQVESTVDASGSIVTKWLTNRSTNWRVLFSPSWTAFINVSCKRIRLKRKIREGSSSVFAKYSNTWNWTKSKQSSSPLIWRRFSLKVSWSRVCPRCHTRGCPSKARNSIESSRLYSFIISVTIHKIFTSFATWLFALLDTTRLSAPFLQFPRRIRSSTSHNHCPAELAKSEKINYKKLIFGFPRSEIRLTMKVA